MIRGRPIGGRLRGPRSASTADSRSHRGTASHHGETADRCSWCQARRPHGDQRGRSRQRSSRGPRTGAGSRAPPTPCQRPRQCRPGPANPDRWRIPSRATDTDRRASFGLVGDGDRAAGDGYGERIAHQIEAHPRGAGGADVPLSTGGIELIFRRELARRLADRRGLFTNRERLARLVLLMTLHMPGQADERRWAEIIRSYLLERAGRPPRARAIADPEGTSSLRVARRR